MDNEKCCFDAMCANDDGKAALEAGQLGEQCQIPVRGEHTHTGAGAEGPGKWVRIPHAGFAGRTKRFPSDRGEGTTQRLWV